MHCAGILQSTLRSSDYVVGMHAPCRGVVAHPAPRKRGLRDVLGASFGEHTTSEKSCDRPALRRCIAEYSFEYTIMFINSRNHPFPRSPSIVVPAFACHWGIVVGEAYRQKLYHLVFIDDIEVDAANSKC